jgi:hypothetical protein
MYYCVLASFDPRIRVIRGNKLVRIRVLILKTKILAGTDPGDPRVDSCPALAARRHDQEPRSRHDLGRMQVKCRCCRTQHWTSDLLKLRQRPDFEFTYQMSFHKHWQGIPASFPENAQGHFPFQRAVMAKTVIWMSTT